MNRLMSSILTAAAFLSVSAISQASMVLPLAVRHALWLQTQSRTALETYPCTAETIRESESRANTEIENGDTLPLAAEQDSFAASFARCALSGTDTDTVLGFSLATLQSMTAMITAQGPQDSQSLARAKQGRIIAHWLLAQPLPPANRYQVQQALAQLARVR